MKLHVLNIIAIMCVMNFLCCGTTLALTQSETPYAARPHKEEVITFHSNALNAETTATVFIPDPVEDGKQYPVLYLLHGFGGNHRQWADVTSLTLVTAGYEMIFVLPDAAYGGWYIDSPRIPNHKYETLITKDVINEIDSRYPTINRREGRAVTGLSMGAHGATTLAEKHPDLFCSVSALSGVYNMLDFPKHTYLINIMGELPAARDIWTQNSSIYLVDKLTTANLPLLFDCGWGDVYVSSSREWHEVLNNHAIAHTYREFPGEHSFNYWHEHLPEHIAFHERNIRSFLANNPPTAGIEQCSTQRKHAIQRAMLFEKETQNYLDSNTSAGQSVILLGDNIFESLEFPDDATTYTIINRGIRGDGVGLTPESGILNRIYHTIVPLKPQAIFICTGADDIDAATQAIEPTVEGIANTYDKAVGQLIKALPNTKIFILPTLPTCGAKTKNNAMTKRLNEHLFKMAAHAGQHVKFINTNEILATKEGHLNPNFADTDNSLNNEGNNLLRKSILEALK